MTRMMEPILLKAVLAAITYRLSPGVWADREVVPYAAQVSVWGRWFIALVSAFELIYLPGSWYPHRQEPLFLMIPLVAVNGLVHYRLLTNRPVTWKWMLFLSAMDITLISISIGTAPKFDRFVFVAYYPSLAMFVLVFTSVWLGLAWTSLTAAVYLVATLTSDAGVDMNAWDEKVLVGRLAAMFVLVICVILITRFERTRRRAATEGERRLQRERVELSQEIHDTAAQTAYMISMGIHRAGQLAGDSSDELKATLDATAALTRAAMWELRRPIEAGPFFDGRNLGPALWSHCETFESITGVPSSFSQTGSEPPIPVEARAGLFSIAHNALTNAFRHANPGKVEVRLSFETDRIRLSVSDDGVGLPDDYRTRGRGFSGMEADAQKLAGTLLVASGNGESGTTVSCVVPYTASE